ncbi:MAG: hypothetical protein A2X94_16875 [Bdellovibrionales bacterium GWB1_55_8]|nr:MAG: hypothetical protein A2X94_16875 [Bdellovibrionales bacterium GWB1_55_8]
MFKRSLALALALAAATLIVSGTSASYAYEAQLQTVLGKANFERRSTVVPMAVCEAEPCAKPTIYWSLVLIDGGVRYEVNQIFALGSRTQPSSIEIAGVRVNLGAQVEIEGRVQALGSDYALVSDVNKATILPDDVESNETPQVQQLFLPMAYGWTCLSQEERVPLQVHILYSGNQAGADRFEIHVGQIRSTSIKPVATALDAIQNVDEERIIFRGKGDSGVLQVLIDRTQERFNDLPAFLTMSKGDPGAFIVHDLRCDRTRF